MCEQDIQNVPVLTSTASLPQAYLLRFVHTHTLYIQKRKVLFGFYSSPVISLLVQAT